MGCVSSTLTYRTKRNPKGFLFSFVFIVPARSGAVFGVFEDENNDAKLHRILLLFYTSVSYFTPILHPVLLYFCLYLRKTDTATWKERLIAKKRFAWKEGRESRLIWRFRRSLTAIPYICESRKMDSIDDLSPPWNSCVRLIGIPSTRR